jgi:dTDP-4-amino-4,6-dideoxygalactose transaminase
MIDLGYNYRLSDVHAALGVSQLKNVTQKLERRKKIAQKYKEAFNGTPIRIMEVEDQAYHAYHLFIILVEDRKGMYDYLRENNIFTQVHYIPIHLQPYYKEKGWKEGDLPEAEKYYESCLSLPMYPSLTNSEQDFVIQKVLDYI